MLKEMAEPLVFVPTLVAGVDGFLLGGAIVEEIKEQRKRNEQQNLL
jgi:hypothetical protein